MFLPLPPPAQPVVVAKAGQRTEIGVLVEAIDELIAWLLKRGVTVWERCHLRCYRDALANQVPKLMESMQDLTLNDYVRGRPDRIANIEKVRHLVGAGASLQALRKLLPMAENKSLGNDPGWRKDLAYFAEGDPNHFSHPDPSFQDHGPRNHQFEMICAAVFSTFATHVSMKEPDIVVTFENIRWGIACKAIHGKPKRSIVGNVRKGADQIKREITKGSVDLGIVVVETTNIFDHDRFFRTGDPQNPFRTFSDGSAAVNFLNPMTYLLCKPMNDSLRKNAIIDKQARGVLYVTQTVAARDDHELGVDWLTLFSCRAPNLLAAEEEAIAEPLMKQFNKFMFDFNLMTPSLPGVPV